MNPHTYDRSINGCILVAVVSALLFERMGDLRWLAGSFGMLAGLTATGLYFYNQWKSDDNDNLGDTGLVEENSAEQYSFEPLTHRRKVMHAEIARFMHVPFDFSSEDWDYPVSSQRNFAGLLYYKRQTAASHAKGKEFSELVTEVVERLSDEYEYEITQDGRFVIRSAKDHKMPQGEISRKQEPERLRSFVPQRNEQGH